MSEDALFMQRCLELAANGRGHVSPNPLVGAVVVHQGKVVGEGWHQEYGGPHAEVNAIAAVADPSILPECTVYVNLEPCSHFGKTPPCADMLIRHRVKRVVVGMVDPFAKVAGSGIEKLRAAGIEVVVGILEAACSELNKRFITFHTAQRPYVILKWAQTADGYLGPDIQKVDLTEYNKTRQLTGANEQLLVHKWRTEEDAFLVGTNTAMHDNPMLTPRLYPGRAPLRVVLDLQNRLPQQLHVFDGSVPARIYTHANTSEMPSNITRVQVDPNKPLWPQVWHDLHSIGIQSVVVEGGAYTLRSLMETDQWDEQWVFTTDFTIGSGVKAPETPGDPETSFRFTHSHLAIYRR